MYSGYIFTGPPQKMLGRDYCGVDSEFWSIDIKRLGCFSDQEIKFFEEKRFECIIKDIPFLLKSDQKDRFIDGFINKGIPFSCYYCDFFDYSELSCYGINQKKDFLGFDYAFGGEGYYSCVLMDILYRPSLLRCLDLINEYGLLRDKQSLTKFINLRTEKEMAESKGVFESGPFYVYSVYTGIEKMTKAK